LDKDVRIRDIANNASPDKNFKDAVLDTPAKELFPRENE